MNFEESRLRTFKNWPSNAPVDASRIAKAGFYYMGQNMEVQCFSCGGRISEWNYNDKVMTRHRALDPRCPFVLSPALSGNVPVTSSGTHLNSSQRENRSLSRPEQIQSNDTLGTTSGATSNFDEDQMHEESARFQTFTNWPIPFVSAKSLAEAGFYYVQQGDKVRCAFCSVIIGRWEVGDSPMLEHRRHSPHCSFVHRHLCSSEPENANSSGITFRKNAGDISENAMKSLGVKVHRVAKHPKYSSRESRLATYTTWPRGLSQTPEDLAEAGFYYAGSDDQVRCFHCDGGLRKWESSDDPWVEHARWFPDCGFIANTKGEEFIDESIQQYPPVLPEMVTNNPQRVSRSETLNMSPVRQVTEEELESLMSSPTATAALQIGLDLSRVKMAIRQKLEQTGAPFSSPHDLIEATLDIQLDEVPFHDTEETWSTPLHSPVRRLTAGTRLAKVLRARPISTEESESSESEYTVEAHPINSQSTPETCQEGEDTSATASGEGATTDVEHKVTLEEENRRLKEARLCKICMDSEVCIVFLPCGHLVTCIVCAHSLAACPLCRKTIKATVRTFLS